MALPIPAVIAVVLQLDSGASKQSIALLTDEIVHAMKVTERDVVKTAHAASSQTLFDSAQLVAPAEKESQDSIDRLEAACSFVLLAANLLTHATISKNQGVSGHPKTTPSSGVLSVATGSAQAASASSTGISSPSGTHVAPIAVLTSVLAAVHEAVDEDADEAGRETAARGAANARHTEIQAPAETNARRPPVQAPSSPMRSREFSSPSSPALSSPGRGGGSGSRAAGRPGRTYQREKPSEELGLFSVRRLWNDAAHIASLCDFSAHAVIALLHMMGHRVWVNYGSLASVAKERGHVIPSAVELFLKGVRARSVVELNTPTPSSFNSATMMGRPESSEDSGSSTAWYTQQRSIELPPGTTMSPALRSMLRTQSGRAFGLTSQSETAEAGAVAAASSGAAGRGVSGLKTTPSLLSMKPSMSPSLSPGAGTASSSPFALPPPLESGIMTPRSSAPALVQQRGCVRKPSLSASDMRRLPSIGGAALGALTRNVSFTGRGMGTGSISMGGSPLSVATFLAAVSAVSTGTVNYVSTMEPMNSVPQVHVIMPVARFDGMLQRIFRLASKAACYRRRLVFLLMMDRMVRVWVYTRLCILPEPAPSRLRPNIT